MQIKNYFLNAIQAAHDVAGQTIGRIAPLLAPIPSAMAVQSATGSIMIAIVIETLGFAIVAEGLRIYTLSRKLGTNGKTALRLPAALFTIYLVAVLLIIAAAGPLTGWHELQAGTITTAQFVGEFAALFYPLLNLVGAAAYAMVDWGDFLAEDVAAEAEVIEAERSLDLEMKRAEAGIRLESKRARAKAKIEALRSGVPAKRNETQPRNTGRNGDHGNETASRRATVRDALRANPAVSLADLAASVGANKSAVYRDVRHIGATHDGEKWVIPTNGNGVPHG